MRPSPMPAVPAQHAGVAEATHGEVADVALEGEAMAVLAPRGPAAGTGRIIINLAPKSRSIGERYIKTQRQCR